MPWKRGLLVSAAALALVIHLLYLKMQNPPPPLPAHTEEYYFLEEGKRNCARAVMQSLTGP